MLPPIQNQDLVQRSDAMSELRSHEQAKAFSDIAKSAAEMHRLEQLKDTTVQKDDESDELNPDGGNGKQEQQNKRRQEEAQPETNTPAGHPLKLDGGDIVDMMA